MSRYDQFQSPGANEIRIPDELEAIIPIFLEEMREYVEAITSAMEVSDFQAIQALGHTIKGTAGNFGVVAISDIGRSVESAANGGDLESLGALVNELSACLGRIGSRQV